MHDVDVLTQGSQNTIKGKICAECACESYKNKTPVWERGVIADEQGKHNEICQFTTSCKWTSVLSGCVFKSYNTTGSDRSMNDETYPLRAMVIVTVRRHGVRKWERKSDNNHVLNNIIYLMTQLHHNLSNTHWGEVLVWPKKKHETNN